MTESGLLAYALERLDRKGQWHCVATLDSANSIINSDCPHDRAHAYSWLSLAASRLLVVARSTTVPRPMIDMMASAPDLKSEVGEAVIGKHSPAFMVEMADLDTKTGRLAACSAFISASAAASMAMNDITHFDRLVGDIEESAHAALERERVRRNWADPPQFRLLFCEIPREADTTT